MKNMVIHKFRVAQIPMAYLRFVLPMEKEARVLSLQVQKGAPTIWAETPDRDHGIHSIEEVQNLRVFQWVPTGDMVPRGCEYVGTLQFLEGELVYHLYELIGGTK